MSATLAIEAKGLGKRYRIQPGPAAGSRMLREDLVAWTRGLLGRGRDDGPREVWAVRDVDLEIEAGEAFGLIGHNGAGKSTLLRLLSSVTAPTEGRARIRGRVGTLLEVGTGFHLELTGRENVYLQAAVLGMKQAEAARRLPEIVAMAGIGDYLEVPVKRYSTGMFVRLAFAVAAHLESEILLVDEILAVGDAEFRRRCLGTLDRAVADGRTVVFVSHNTAAVEQVCSRVAYLARGRVAFVGSAAEAAQRYHADQGSDPRDLSQRGDREGSLAATVQAIELLDGNGHAVEAAVAGGPVAIRLRYRCAGHVPSGGARLELTVHTHLDTPVFVHDSEYSADELGAIAAAGTFSCELPRLPLPPSVYRLSYRVWVGGTLVDGLSDAYLLRVEPGDFYRSGLLPDARDAVCLVDAAWRHEA